MDFNEIIEIWKDPSGKESLPTTRGTIHYSKDGAHIIPTSPKELTK